MLYDCIDVEAPNWQAFGGGREITGCLALADGLGWAVEGGWEVTAVGTGFLCRVMKMF